MDRASSWEMLCQGKCGVAELQGFDIVDVNQFRVHFGAQVKNSYSLLYMDRKEATTVTIHMNILRLRPRNRGRLLESTCTFMLSERRRHRGIHWQRDRRAATHRTISSKSSMTWGISH